MLSELIAPNWQAHILYQMMWQKSTIKLYVINAAPVDAKKEKPGFPLAIFLIPTTSLFLVLAS
jgi:hypothetical protein